MEAEARLVISLDAEALARLQLLADKRGVSLDQLVGELLLASVEELERRG